ncbi:MAG: right-handed parallel beta-helix repeat-containing protein [Candidatus Electrothrix scaldis]|nr:MAG: right-handed parallel beta-helix repeat-containing protein [Candidatus Electrothrix sp. GW3-3]
MISNKQKLLASTTSYCFTTLFVLLLASVAAAKIIYVPNDYPSLSAAIQAAQEKDTIRVAQGKYLERVSLRPGIILEGSWDSNFTKRDLAASPSILGGSSMGGFSVLGANNTVIDGFVITGGKAPLIAPDAPIGPGIFASGITITIKNNLIMANNAAGIFLHTCNAKVISNIIIDNGQAGIFLEKNTSALIQGNKISQNLAAGIRVGDNVLSAINVSNNVLDNNKRAGINAAWATGIIRNNIVYENGHAGIRAAVSPMLIANNTVTKNVLAGISIGEPPLDGTSGGNKEETKTPEIKNNIITHNGEAGIYSNGSGYSHNLLFANNKVNGFHPDFLWYTRLQFGGYEDIVSLEKSKHILADPLFVDPAQHDYHLRPGSPAIDSGDPDVTFNDKNFGPSLGADINDMGAYGGPFTIAEARPVNLAPVADIELPKNPLYAGDKITLNGEVSTDPNGDELSYTWYMLDKPVGSKANLSANSKSKTKLACDKGGTYRIRLDVTDRWGFKSSPKTITLRVDPNKPPTAKISKQMEPVNVGDTVKLSTYDKKKQNGDELKFFWSFSKKPPASKASIVDASAAKPTFVMDTPGCYTVQLRVYNGKKYSEAATSHICSRQSRFAGQRIVPDEYPTIQSALDTAEPNDQIIVKAGTYKEKIIVDKAVDLIGVGWPVIDGGGEDNNDATVFICYLDNTSTGKMEGFVVTGGGSGIFGHGLQILNSSPEIFNNRIRGNKHVGIGIHGHKRFTEKTRIHNNFIYDNAIGVSHGLGTYGQVYDNTIYNNKVTGIGVRGLSKPTLRGNKIYDNYVGIGVREEAYPQIENNEIRNNIVGIAINPGAANAVYAEEENRIKIRNNSVYSNEQCGIFISSLHRNGIVTQGNVIRDNNTSATPRNRSGGAVVGYPHESLSDIFLHNNDIRGNNGKNIQQFKAIASSYGEIGDSKNRRPF